MDDDLSGDLIVGAISDGINALDLSGTNSNQGPYLDTTLPTDSISNAITWSQKEQVDHSATPDILLGAYDKEYASLTIQDIIHDQS